MLPNGHLPFSSQHTPPVPARVSSKPSANAPEMIALENKNWLIHYHFTRREFGICDILIKEELRKSNGMNEFVNYIKGIILRHEGKIQESLEYFQRCHNLNPRCVDNIKQIARSLFLLGRLKLAANAFNEAKNVAPSPEWDIYHNLGVCSLALGDITKAKEYLSQAVQLNRQVKSFEALANIHLLQNDIKGAIDVYNAATDVSRDDIELSTSLGLLYMRIGENQKAFEKFGTALAHDPQNAKALLAIGSMMQNHKEYDVALSKYKIASLKMSDSPYLWNNIGMCFFGKKKYIAAVSCLRKANCFSPMDWKILYNLGLIHLMFGQYASAFHFLSSAISLQKRVGVVYLALAVTLIHLEDFKNASYAFEQAKKTSQNVPIVFLNFSVFLYKRGDLIRAEGEFKKFQELSQKADVTNYGVRLETISEIASILRRSLKITDSSNPRAAAEAEPEPEPGDGRPRAVDEGFRGDGATGTGKNNESESSGIEREMDPDEV